MNCAGYNFYNNQKFSIIFVMDISEMSWKNESWEKYHA